MHAYNPKTGAKKRIRKDIHHSMYIKETEFSMRLYINSPCFKKSGYEVVTEKEISGRK